MFRCWVMFRAGQCSKLPGAWTCCRPHPSCACVTPVRPGEEPTKHFCPPSNHFVSTFLRQKTRNRWSEPKESSKLDIKISVCCTERVKSFMDNAQIDSRALFRKASSGSVRVTIKTEDGSLCLTGWEPQCWGLHNTSCQLRIWLCLSVAAAYLEVIIVNSKRHISRTTIETQRGSICLTGWAADVAGF